jgi:hypothetical protein
VFAAEQTAKKENLFIFVFKEGVAQSNINVKVGDESSKTDEFGVAAFTLPAGDHEVGYYKGGELFALTDVALLEIVSSQVFLNLTNQGESVELDLPLSAYEQDFDHQDVKPQTGPKGNLIFSVRDSANDAAVSGAKLFFKGYAIDAITDEKGIATVELAAGDYDISVIHPTYVMQVSKDVSVRAETDNEHAVKLIKADIVLDEFVVSAPFVEGSLASNIAELKDSDVVGDAISSEQFSKSGDSDAAGALKRVTGITIVDDKFVFVRGLGERYSTVLLNGLEVPSPEPTKRVVPLDIFPAGVIQSMDIQKTFSSDIPGTFGGGTILINTKDIPKEDNYISGSISVTVNDATGNDVVHNPDNDQSLPGILLNLSDGFKALTNEVKVGDLVLAEGITAAERTALDKAMVSYRSYGITETKLDPGTSLSTSFGQSFKTSGGMKYGFAGNLYYKNEQNNSADVTENTQADANQRDKDKTFGKTVLNEKLGGLVSFGLEPTSNSKIKYTFVGLNEEEDQTKQSQIYDYLEERSSEKVLLRYTEKELYSHQLSGEGLLGEKSGSLLDALNLSTALSFSSATRLEPGTFEYVYKESNSGSGLAIDKNKMFYQYSNLEDEVLNFRADASLPFTLNGQDNKISWGSYFLSKERTLDNRRFKFSYNPIEDDTRAIDDILVDSLAVTERLDLTSNYRQEDAYLAEQSLVAFYVNALISPFNALDLNFGFRQEQSTQDLEVGIEEDSLESYSLETSDTLPFFGATFRVSDEHQFRFAYSNTLTRPDFREFSPTRYKDPETDYVVRGNPDLKYTEITNIDFKYEWFPSFDEFLSFGLFTKSFTNPIETVRSVPDEDIEISYVNAEGADSFGFELGFRKSLDGLLGDLEHYFVEGNYAWIHSEVQLNQSDIDSYGLTTNDRAMQGQSPYVTNIKFGYDNFFTRRSAMFLYNVFGKRIYALGVDGVADAYEQPFQRLDFVVKWGLNDTYDEQEKKIGYTVSLKIKNLLDQDEETLQGGQVANLESPGRSATVGFSMKF